MGNDDKQESPNPRKLLIAKIAQCKGSLTKAENFIRDLPPTHADKEAISARLQQLQNVLPRYEQLMLELSVTDDVASDKSFVEDEFEDRYLAVVAKLRGLLAFKPDPEPPAQQPSNACSANVRLPEIDIPSFDGKDYTKYHSFIELFSAVIDNNSKLASIQKLFYLRKYLKGEPLSLIEGLPVTGDSYTKALELLKNRYDNKFLIITNHVQELLDFRPLMSSGAANLRELISHARQHLGALKTLGQSTESWDLIVLPILLRKVDQFSCRAYHSERDTTELPKLDEFFAFIERRASSFEESQRSEGKTTYKNIKVSNFASKSNMPLPTCRYCSETSHKLFKCDKFLTLSPMDRLDFVTKNNLCQICLNSHSNKCKFHFKCEQCKDKAHNTLLHCDDEFKKVSMHSNSNVSTVLLPTIKAKVLGQDGKSYKVVRGLVDSGSQVSFMTAELAKALQLKHIDSNLNITALGKQNKTTSKAVNAEFLSLQNKFKCRVTCSIVDQITTKLPQSQVNLQNVRLPDSVTLADNDFDTPGDISFLLSADIFFQILLPTKIKLQNSNLYLIDTQFGSILSGEVLSSSSCVTNHHVTLHAICDNNVDHLLQKFWETEMVPETKMEVTSKQVSCEAEFKASVQLVDGKFVVPLPLNCPPNEINLGNTYFVALKSLLGLQKRFLKNHDLKQRYSDFINEYIKLGHAKVIDLKNFGPGKCQPYFMLHHPVIRDDKKTTKLRVVFNGNTKASTQHNSLNEMLLSGPNNQKDLFDILVLFRTHKYVMLADIQHMYRAINIDPASRHLQNILWQNEDGTNIGLQLQTVTYGLKNSSYLAVQCLLELADRYAEEMPHAARVIRTSMYVDDSLFGADSIEDALLVRNELVKLLGLGGFQLHKWAANHPALLEGIPASKQHFSERALGVSYDVGSDQFKVSSPRSEPVDWNKRSILSYIGSLFDPLGLAAPVILKAKKYMQELWLQNLEWDSPVPHAFLKEWLKFYQKLNCMPNLHVDRYLNLHNADCIQIFGFCDAASGAIGACIYVKTIKHGNVAFTLLCAKSRVTSLKNKLTIPKLELNAAQLLAKLYNKVMSILSTIRVDASYLYSDSQVTLCWLKSAKNNLPCFIRNRVNNINQLTSDCTWHHIPGPLNPADCLSRGCDPQQLANNDLWWHGPEHLRDENYLPPTDNTCAHVACQVVTHADGQSDGSSADFFENFSTLGRLLRVVAWIYRFAHNCKSKPPAKRVGHLTADEIRNSLHKIICKIQYQHFSAEIKCAKNEKPVKGDLAQLNPFICDRNLLRVGGRLQNAPVPYSQKHPIILPNKCHVTKLIIRNEHIVLLNAGLNLVLSNLKLKYWIISASRETKKIINKCIKCYRFKAQAASQIMGSLPSDRVTEGHPFAKVGIDYCGPFQVKQSGMRRAVVTKGYTLVIVCFATKAVHLEFVSDMTTQNFIAALKRFIGRRGIPEVINCDNAQTFKGADNSLHDLYKLTKSNDHQTAVAGVAAERGITFRFIPTYSPNHGGLWEAAVKSFKYHFKRIVGENKFTYEELNTILIEIEGVLNSRPLTQMSRDPTDISALTPGHFLTGRPITCIPEPDLTDIPLNRLRFWRRCTQIKQHFWKSWYSQYLSQLNIRTKWHKLLPDIEEGCLVLLKADNAPPLQWALARVTRVFRGGDRRVRVVELKTATGVTRRSINKLCVLPIDN